jgi:putative tryptophan/tyrosine transport system substrate-binding protein
MTTLRSSLLALILTLSVGTPAARAAREGRSPGAPPRIVVVLSSDAQPYRDGLAGLRRGIALNAATLVVVELHGDSTKVAEAVDAIQGPPRAAVVVTLGTMATRAVLKRVADVPVVAGMILNAAELDGAANATAAYLEYPVEVELEWMARVLPGRRHIGIVYHGSESARRVEKARQLATIQAIHIDGPAELPDALQQLTNRADVLWSVYDPVVYNPETARSLLLFSLRNRIPMVGQSAAWVRAGALYALDRDYDDVGAQCAELTVLILGGTPPGQVAPVPPRKVLFTVNARTASDLRLVLPDAILRVAAEVVR